jgi:hypothetical protein
MDSASRREYGRRSKGIGAPDRPAAPSRGSAALNTGSENTASIFVARARPRVSRRMTSRTDADGRLTTSWPAIIGQNRVAGVQLPDGSASAANGM